MTRANPADFVELHGAGMGLRQEEFVMTRNKAQKAAVRRSQATTAKPYTLARREYIDPAGARPVLCSTVAASLQEHMSQVGWAGPESMPLLDRMVGQWNMWFGPVHVAVRRDTDVFADQGDPDEGVIDGALPEIVAMFPGIQSIDMGGDPTEHDGPIERTFIDHGFTDAVMAGDMKPTRMAAKIRSAVAEGRSRGLAAYTTDRECTVCNRRLAYRHFLRIDHHWLCPYCVFDQDVAKTLHPGRFALIYDELFLRDSTVPHQWSAFAAMFAWANQQAGGTRKGLLLDLVGSQHPLSPMLLEHWDDPLDTWVWLPQSDRLPRPVQDLGTGACLGHVMDVWERACPDLQARFIDSVFAEWTGEFARTAQDKSDFENHVRRLWPVLMAAMICVSVPDRLAGDFTDEWGDQFADSPHAEALEDHFGLPYALTGSVANPFDYLSNLADLAAPEVRPV